MEIILKLDHWEATRLKSLVNDGFTILKEEGRTQRGIDGYTKSDLNNFIKFLNAVSNNIPGFAGIGTEGV